MEELLASSTATAKKIMNVPDAQEMCNLCALVHHVLQPLRDELKQPIKISSGFRSKALNAAVGGVTNSQHTLGQAVDISIDGDMNFASRIVAIIRAKCDFDQLIFEHNAKGTHWVHVSYRSDGQNRKQYIPNLLKR